MVVVPPARHSLHRHACRVWTCPARFSSPLLPQVRGLQTSVQVKGLAVLPESDKSSLYVNTKLGSSVEAEREANDDTQAHVA